MKDNINIFSDILTPEAMNNAETRVYPSYKINGELDSQIREAIGGLANLLSAVKAANKYSNSEITDKEYVKHFKDHFDNIAFIINDFTNEFRPIYENVANIYVAEKLFGTFDKHESESHSDYAIPTRGISIGSSAKTAWKATP